MPTQPTNDTEPAVVPEPNDPLVIEKNETEELEPLEPVDPLVIEKHETEEFEELDPEPVVPANGTNPIPTEKDKKVTPEVTNPTAAKDEDFEPGFVPETMDDLDMALA